MSKVKFILNRKGVSQLLKGEEIQTVLESYGTDIKKRAGEGYDMNSRVGKTRANTMVYADSIRAKRDNLKNNTLLKAMKWLRKF